MTFGLQVYDVTAGIKSINTKIHYKWAFSYFLKYLKLEECTILLEKDPRFIEATIIDFIVWMAEDKKLAHNSIKSILAPVLHFFEMNDIVLNRHKIGKFVPADENSREDRCYTYEEIAKLLEAADERFKVVILLMASTGMRIGAIPGLEIGHISQISSYKLYKIQVYALSRNDRYYAFCTPECSVAIDSYLAYRERCGETLKPSTPLIREQFDIYDKFHAAHPCRISTDSLEKTMERIIKKAGINTTGEVMRNHGLRKFAITQMIKAKVGYDAREYLVGHRGSRGLDIHYDRTSEEDRLMEYLKAVDLLTIDPKQRLEKENQELKSEQAEEIARLKEEIERNRKNTEHVQAMVEAVKGAIAAKSEAATFSLNL
jgi:integrase